MLDRSQDSGMVWGNNESDTVITEEGKHQIQAPGSVVACDFFNVGCFFCPTKTWWLC